MVEAAGAEASVGLHHAHGVGTYSTANPIDPYVESAALTCLNGIGDTGIEVVVIHVVLVVGNVVVLADLSIRRVVQNRPRIRQRSGIIAAAGIVPRTPDVNDVGRSATETNRPPIDVRAGIDDTYSGPPNGQTTPGGVVVRAVRSLVQSGNVEGECPFAVVLVVMLHCFNDVLASGQSTRDGWRARYMAVLRTLHMPECLTDDVPGCIPQ